MAQVEAPAPAQPAAKPKGGRKAKEQQAHEEPLASQGEPDVEGTDEPIGVPCLSPEQRGKLRLYLNTYKVDFQAFLQWASSKGLISPTADVADFGLDDIRADQFAYIESLFNHERSRNQFIQHLASLSAKTA